MPRITARKYEIYYGPMYTVKSYDDAVSIMLRLTGATVLEITHYKNDRKDCPVVKIKIKEAKK